LQNPGRYVDPRGEQSLSSGGGIFIILPGSPANQEWADNTSRQIDRGVEGLMSHMEGGRASGSNPVTHDQENEALDFAPDPFGSGNSYCQNLKYYINVLRQGIAWRKTDLNWFSSGYHGHKTRIALMATQLRLLEQHYINVCGGEACPVDF
jgi:hypothetical protein